MWACILFVYAFGECTCLLVNIWRMPAIRSTSLYSLTLFRCMCVEVLCGNVFAIVFNWAIIKEGHSHNKQTRNNSTHTIEDWRISECCSFCHRKQIDREYKPIDEFPYRVYSVLNEWIEPLNNCRAQITHSSLWW